MMWCNCLVVVVVVYLVVLRWSSFHKYITWLPHVSLIIILQIHSQSNPCSPPFNQTTTWVRMLAGKGSAAGNNVDLDYVNGSGVGGIGPNHGSPGLAILRPQTLDNLQRKTSHTQGNDTELHALATEQQQSH